MPQGFLIRFERPGDAAATAQVVEQAFRGHAYSAGTEQHIVADLRQAGVLRPSLVAESKGELVGHIAFSPVAIADGTPNWYGLGPLAVVPAMQGRGIGHALVHAGLAALREERAQGCVVLGDPAFYGRFGFSNWPQLLLGGVPQEYFLALSLSDHRPAGYVFFHPAFSDEGR